MRSKRSQRRRAKHPSASVNELPDPFSCLESELVESEVRRESICSCCMDLGLEKKRRAYEQAYLVWCVGEREEHVYILIHPRNMAEILEERALLVSAFARREGGAEEVLIDALLERAVWSGSGWPEAQVARDKRPHLNLFWVGGGRIRQNVLRVLPPGRRRITKKGSLSVTRGWKEIGATAGVRRVERSKKGTSS